MNKVKLLLYCTKAKPYLYDKLVIKSEKRFSVSDNMLCDYYLNGKIVAECDCEKVEKISCCCVPYRNSNNLGYQYFLDNGVYKVEWKENNSNGDNPKYLKDDGVVFERNDRYIDTMLKNEDLKKMCLSPQQLLDYIKLGRNGYALHLSNLSIYDEPKELSEFCKDSLLKERILKAPQNMMNAYDKNGNKYILISIRPEWLCKILNGEKTIEVRKQILRELMELENE